MIYMAAPKRRSPDSNLTNYVVSQSICLFLLPTLYTEQHRKTAWWAVNFYKPAVSKFSNCKSTFNEG